MMLSVVSGVGQQHLEGMPSIGLQSRPMELQVVRLGATINHHAQEEVTVDVADGRELGITSLVVTLVTFAAAGVVAGDVPRLQACGVDSDPRAALADQSGSSGEINGRIKQSASAPFFSRRPSA